MKKRIAAVFTIFVFLFVFGFSSFAFAYQNDAYYNDVKIGITRMSATSINAVLEGDYRINNQLFNSGTSHGLTFVDGKISYAGGLYDEVIFEPVNRGGKVRLTSNGSTYGYSNKVIFKVLSGKILPINILSMEEYLKGVVGHEMPPSYPLEALKAQAVAARTYALANLGKHRSEGYDLDDTTHCQVYYGDEISHDPSPVYVNNVLNAIEQTRGAVLLNSGKLVSAFYSASNGGYTEDSGNVWMTSLPYIKSQQDTFDGIDAAYNWSKDFTSSDIDSILKSKGYIKQSNMVFSGNWTSLENANFSKGTAGITNSPWASVEFTFEGTGIKLLGNTDTSSGIISVSVDNSNGQYIDTYSDTQQFQKVLYEKTGLTSGAHKITIFAVGTKNEKALDAYLNVDALEVVGGTQPGLYQESNSAFLDIDINSITRYASGRVSNITFRYRDIFGEVISRSVSKESARTFLSLNSSMYDVVNNNGSYRFTGKGSGHGIGLSQVGAKNRAYAKQGYRDILSFYYPGTTVEIIPPFAPTITSFTLNTATAYADITNVTASAVTDIGMYGQVLYAFDVYRDGTLYTWQGYSENAAVSFRPTKAGNYTINVYAKNKLSSQAYDDFETASIAVQPEANTWTGLRGINVQRIYGIDRYDTAIQISKEGWQNGSENVVLATGEDFPDALASAPLAKALNAPILLTYSTTIEDRVINEIKRLGAKNVYIIGAYGAVAQSIEGNLRNAGVTKLIRLSGSDRYATSVRIAQEVVKLTGRMNEIAVVTGRDFPDAVSIAPFAADRGMPILLTYDSVVPNSVSSFISGKNISKSYVIGGTGVISEAVKQSYPNAERLSGTNRAETNNSVIRKFVAYNSTTSFTEVTGENFPDAITASALASRTKSPIVLTEGSMIPATRETILSTMPNLNNIKIIGSNVIVPISTLDGIAR